MIYSNGVFYSVMGRIILMNMGFPENVKGTLAQGSPTVATANANTSITVYSGTQPNANVIINDWASYNTSYLLHKSNLSYSWPFGTTSANSTFITLRPTQELLNAQTAIATGNAEWAIIWSRNQVEANVRSATIPTTSFFIAPVSDIFGNGVVKLSDTNIANGNSYTITDSTITISF